MLFILHFMGHASTFPEFFRHILSLNFLDIVTFARFMLFLGCCFTCPRKGELFIKVNFIGSSGEPCLLPLSALAAY